MSWKTINTILALAAVDETFCHELLKNPVVAIQMRQFSLSSEEQMKISRIRASDLSEFSKMVLILFRQNE
ncbi:hypothetical protein [Tengunoibacter tsumagoiensis]|uniref:Uncharacterized protein n=1 Tax=Tengunoibacter tsumagoiensis TaxID=2014871 RepID=A0A402A787_9CHLR|nr:hypothetical protein [Tengunoibacter tsumagoiensis]GCE14905.1 hypothetical protein KTT_47640 [Tengunoibacter tsumagoiensis]